MQTHATKTHTQTTTINQCSLSWPQQEEKQTNNNHPVWQPPVMANSCKQEKTLSWLQATKQKQKTINLCGSCFWFLLAALTGHAG